MDDNGACELALQIEEVGAPSFCRLILDLGVFFFFADEEELTLPLFLLDDDILADWDVGASELLLRLLTLPDNNIRSNALSTLCPLAFRVSDNVLSDVLIPIPVTKSRKVVNFVRKDGGLLLLLLILTRCV